MAAQRNTLIAKISFVTGVLAFSVMIALFLIGAIISLINYEEGVAFSKLAMVAGVIATPMYLVGFILGIIGIWLGSGRRRISAIGTVLNALLLLGTVLIVIYALISLMRSAGH